MLSREKKGRKQEDGLFYQKIEKEKNQNREKNLEIWKVLCCFHKKGKDLLRYNMYMCWTEVCKGLGECLDWSDTLGSLLLKKEDRSPSVFLKRWTVAFWCQIKLSSHIDGNKKDFFSFKKPSVCPLLLVEI